MRIRLSLAASVSLLLLGGGAAALSAQTVLINPGFKTGLTGWEVGADTSWDGTRDAGNSPSSGSARATASFDRAGLVDVLVSQCIPAIGSGDTFQLSGKAFIPAGQTGSGAVLFSVGFFPDIFCQGPPIPGAGGALTPPITATNAWTSTAATFDTVGKSARLVAFLQASSAGSFGANVDDLSLLFIPPASCFGDPHALCLSGLRFKVTATYDAGDGNAGDASAVSLSGDTGYLWFFDPSNVEVVVKVLYGCNLGGHFWVFVGGLTDVHTVITVTDTQTGRVKTYMNPAGQAFAPIQDNSAFACP